MTYAEKVWEEMCEKVKHAEVRQTSIAIISAALKRQREVCARKAAKHYVNHPMDYDIRNAEVE